MYEDNIGWNEYRYHGPLKEEARAYLLNWMEVREAEEVARTGHRLSFTPPLCTPPSNYVPGDPPSRSGMDLPIWFSKSQLLEYVVDDLAEADEEGLTVDETMALYPYMLPAAKYVFAEDR